MKLYPETVKLSLVSSSLFSINLGIQTWWIGFSSSNASAYSIMIHHWKYMKYIEPQP